jgi:Golgi nucleoside diphosphatase
MSCWCTVFALCPHVCRARASTAVASSPLTVSAAFTAGLSSYKQVPRDARQSITELVSFAKSHVPLAAWRQTPIFLKATAGLRSIPQEDANKILDECRDVLRASVFAFRDEWARVISGQQEGVFSWVAANYLEGSFAPDATSTVGVVEMGGGTPWPAAAPPPLTAPRAASLQVVFVPEKATPKMPQVVDIKMGGRAFSVYSHSYLNCAAAALASPARS